MYPYAGIGDRPTNPFALNLDKSKERKRSLTTDTLA
jgi:hypothetical protein